MQEELDDFSIAAFQVFLSESAAVLNLCLRLEVLLVKLQDRHPGQSATLLLVDQLNGRGHALKPETTPGLDHYFVGSLDDRRLLEIRSAGKWFSVRVVQA